jgi:DNA (cytosine-5)-methyltransferase 1
VKEDERNYLYDYMIDLALALRPRLFLLENVPGMSSARRNKQSFLDDARNKIEANGTYRASIWKLSASAYGVPQHRVRLFLVASRLRSFPPIPEPEYQDILFPGFDLDALPPVSFGEATFDLPKRSSASGRTVDVRDPEASQTDPRMRRYLNKFRIRTPSKFLYNHRARYHNDRDLELYALLQPGENSVHAVEKHGRRDLMRYRQDVFDDKYARLRSDRPSKTIVAHLAKDGNGYVHPEQVRSITVREAARIQSFDDDYVFCGSPSDQWVQVGNSVPPVLAEVIFRSFRDVLGRNNR